MARFDVYRRPDGGYLLDCQADLLSDFNTRFVVPLLPAKDAPKPTGRLNPLFEIEGHSVVMVTQFAAAVAVKELGDRAGSLIAHDRQIIEALDMLLTGI